MKGTPAAPQCGFSMQVVRVLNAQGKCLIDVWSSSGGCGVVCVAHWRTCHTWSCDALIHPAFPGIKFDSVNVLENAEVRQGIKDYR
jgi:glutaredoxin-related protein